MRRSCPQGYGSLVVNVERDALAWRRAELPNGTGHDRGVDGPSETAANVAGCRHLAVSKEHLALGEYV